MCIQSLKEERIYILNLLTELPFTLITIIHTIFAKVKTIYASLNSRIVDGTSSY